jgi:hypothetical protein
VSDERELNRVHLDSGATTAARLIRLEANFQALESGVAQLIRRFDEFSMSITNDLKAATRQTTPWGVLAAWASVILAVVALAGAPFVSQITSINEDIEALRWRELQTAELRGRSQQRLQLLTDESHALDVKLQREMGLMVDRVHAEIEGLDEALEREMRLMTDANAARIAELRDRLAALEARAVMSSHP